MSDLNFNTKDGGQLSLVDEEVEALEFHWYVESGSRHVYCVVPNTAKLRKFLRRVLARMDKDAAVKKIRPGVKERNPS